jgi:hypothetical protein
MTYLKRLVVGPVVRLRARRVDQRAPALRVFDAVL